MECSQSAKLSFKSVCNCQHASEILRSFAPLQLSQGYWGKDSANLPSAPSAQRPILQQRLQARGNPPTRSTYQMPNCQMPKSRNSPDNVFLTCINILWGYVCATHRPQVAGLCKKVDFNFSSCRSTVKTHMLTRDIHALSLHNNQKTQEKGAECSQSAKLSFKSVCNCQHASESLRSFTLTLPSAPSAQSPTCNSSSRPEEILQPCRSQEIHLTTCF